MLPLWEPDPSYTIICLICWYATFLFSVCVPMCCCPWLFVAVRRAPIERPVLGGKPLAAGPSTTSSKTTIMAFQASAGSSSVGGKLVSRTERPN